MYICTHTLRRIKCTKDVIRWNSPAPAPLTEAFLSGGIDELLSRAASLIGGMWGRLETEDCVERFLSREMSKIKSHES